MIGETRPASSTHAAHEIKGSAPTEPLQIQSSRDFGASFIKSGSSHDATCHWYSPITNFIKKAFYGVWDFLAKWIPYFPTRPAYLLASELGTIVVCEDSSNRDLLKEMDDQATAEVRRILRDPQYQVDPLGYTRALSDNRKNCKHDIWTTDDIVVQKMVEINSDKDWLRDLKDFSTLKKDMKELDARIERLEVENNLFNREQQENAQRLVQTYRQPTRKAFGPETKDGDALEELARLDEDEEISNERSNNRPEDSNSRSEQEAARELINRGLTKEQSEVFEEVTRIKEHSEFKKDPKVYLAKLQADQDLIFKNNGQVNPIHLHAIGYLIGLIRGGEDREELEKCFLDDVKDKTTKTSAESPTPKDEPLNPDEIEFVQYIETIKKEDGVK